MKEGCFDTFLTLFKDRGMNSKNTFRSIFRYVFLTLAALFLNASIGFAQDDAAIQKGQTIFKGQCASCHKIQEKLVGPALAGVYDRRSADWLHTWVKNSQAMVKAGDPDAVALFNQYSKSVMPAFNLSDADIDAVFAYVKQETENPTKPANAAGPAGAAAADGSFFANPINIFLLAIVGLLLAVAVVLNQVGGTLGRVWREKLGQLVPEPIALGKKLFSRKTLALGVLGALILTGYKTVDTAMRLGRQQNYAPTQPIKFSHKVHAGQNQIPCQYCHSGAAKGKSAIIPSPSLCLNCHKAVEKGPKTGKSEIAKIYVATGWNPADKKFFPDNAPLDEVKKVISGWYADSGVFDESLLNQYRKPVEWVRIHNLPDHVYFNHSQHVVAGGVECQTCHGKIEEMDVVKQNASLGMGWCVNCHRRTEVKFQTNDYYKTYERFHKDLKEGKISKVTVDDIGGTECQKCHY